MFEGGEARCSDCGKTPKTCWLPPHLCKHPDREGGEAQARNHKAEVEAVAAAIESETGAWRTSVVAAAEAAIAALDAVRRSPQETCGTCGGERDKPALMSDDSYSEFRCPSPFHRRSPQGEDHEGRMIETARRVADFAYKQGVSDAAAVDDLIAAYLSRCPSPERDTAERLRVFARNLPKSASETYRQAFFDAAEVAGHNPSPERNTKKLVEALRRIERVCGWSDGDGDMAVQIAREALAEFSAASKDSRVSPDHDPGRTD